MWKVEVNIIRGSTVGVIIATVRGTRGVILNSRVTSSVTAVYVVILSVVIEVLTIKSVNKKA